MKTTIVPSNEAMGAALSAAMAVSEALLESVLYLTVELGDNYIMIVMAYIYQSVWITPPLSPVSA